MLGSSTWTTMNACKKWERTDSGENGVFLILKSKQDTFVRTAKWQKKVDNEHESGVLMGVYFKSHTKQQETQWVTAKTVLAQKSLITAISFLQFARFWGSVLFLFVFTFL